MLEEIREQKELLRKLYTSRESLTAEFTRLHSRHRFKKIYFIGNGSPYYGGYTLCFAAEALLHAEAEAIPSGLFHNHKTFDPAGILSPEQILLICPAESGHSKGQVDAARQAKKLGITVMSTTLNSTGVLARTSDIVLAKPGKHEVAMAATKGQTMALYMILLNFLEAGRAAGTLPEAEYKKYMQAMEQVPENVDKTIDRTLSWFWENRERVVGAEKYFLLGYGANFGTVQEAGLKFFECHGKPTLSLELEESLHGPLRGLGKKDVAFFLAAEDGPEKQRMEKLAQALAPHCENRVLICNGDLKGDTLPIASGNVAYVNTIEYLVCLQVLAFAIAEDLGIDLSLPLVADLDPVMLPAYED